MAIDFETLRLEVAKRHNLLLDKSDPILAAVTLNELVLAEFLERSTAVSEEWERRGAALMAQEVATVKSAAERMIVGAAAFFASEVRKASEGAELSIAGALKQRLEAAVAAAERAEAAKRPALWAAALSLAATILTLGVAIGGHLK
jgi:hypothetical protein